LSENVIIEIQETLLQMQHLTKSGKETIMTINTLKCAEMSPFETGAAVKKAGLLATLTHTVLVWQERASMRHNLASLDQENLCDMGLTASDVSHEIRKPFWLQ